jgi:hypothetical protein
MLCAGKVQVDDALVCKVNAILTSSFACGFLFVQEKRDLTQNYNFGGTFEHCGMRFAPQDFVYK